MSPVLNLKYASLMLNSNNYNTVLLSVISKVIVELSYLNGNIGYTPNGGAKP